MAGLLHQLIPIIIIVALINVIVSVFINFDRKRKQVPYYHRSLSNNNGTAQTHTKGPSKKVQYYNINALNNKNITGNQMFFDQQMRDQQMMHQQAFEQQFQTDQDLKDCTNASLEAMGQSMHECDNNFPSDGFGMF